MFFIKIIIFGSLAANFFYVSFIDPSWVGSVFLFVLGVLCLLGIGKIIEDNYHRMRGED